MHFVNKCIDIILIIYTCVFLDAKTASDVKDFAETEEGVKVIFLSLLFS